MKRLLLLFCILIPTIAFSQFDGNGKFRVDTVENNSVKTICYDMTIAKDDSVLILPAGYFAEGWFATDSAGKLDGNIQVIVGFAGFTIYASITPAGYSVRFGTANGTNMTSAGRVWLYSTSMVANSPVYIKNRRNTSGSTHIFGCLNIYKP